MARCTFGGATADFLSAAKVGPSLRSGRAWTAQTGGTQVTDLLAMNGRPIETLTEQAVVDGFIQFQGPADGTSTLWVDAGGAGRVRMVADPIGGFARVVDEVNGAYPDRPVGAVCVIWRGIATPSAAAEGDQYVNLGA